MALLSSRYENDGVSAIELNEIQYKYINLLRDKILNKDYNCISYPCECGSDDFEVLAEKDRYGIPLRTVICKNCGLIMSNPRLDDNSNALFYDNMYHNIYRSETKPSYERFSNRKENAKPIIDFVRENTGLYKGKVLEIGCADGGNVAAFNDAGYEASGIDLSHLYIDYGNSQGLRLFCCSSAEFAEKGEQFDIIIVHHVLEHFTDLKTELNNISRLLNKDGYLFVAVPGVKNLTFKAYRSDFLRMLQSAHVYNFTKDTLCQVMKKHGFDCTFCNESIYGLFRKGSKDNSFKNLYPDVREYLDSAENAKGNNGILLINRMRKILSSYKTDEVLLYGSEYEMDVLVKLLDDTSMIRGLLPSDTDNETAVYDFIKDEKEALKSLIIVNVEDDERLMKQFRSLKQYGIDVYSLYSESF